MRNWVALWAGLLALIFLPSCQEFAPFSSKISPQPGFGPTLTPFQPVPWTLVPEDGDLAAAKAEAAALSLTPQSPPPTPDTLAATPASPFALYIDPHLPSAFSSAIQLPAGLPLTEDAALAGLRIFAGDDYPVSQWVYALVTPFPTVTDEVSARDLLAAWHGKSRGTLDGVALMMDEATLNLFSAFWGRPADGAVQVRSAGELLQTAWQQRDVWAIVPFEALNPRWKVLVIDGVSPLHKDFDLHNYALTLPISMTGAAPELPLLPDTNRDPEKITILAMTGVTALVRATAFTMEQQGNLYPATDIGPILQNADITHISNEVPFAEDCPYPNPVQEGVQFCSRTKYIELLEHVGTDVVELTGDHFADWGAPAMLYTLDLYRQRGWLYYGGGADFQEGRKAITLEHNGNKLAFIGCNAKGGGYATASATNPGAVYCDWDWMQNKIAELRADDYLPIATFQHFEYYTYTAQPNQIRDAERMTQAGAVIVSGSQAHQPQAFQFADGSFIHHGLGNLFFDQLDVSEATRQGFIDLHVFYGGRHISTELVTIYFVDYARARLMTPQERSQLLRRVFSASGW